MDDFDLRMKVHETIKAIVVKDIVYEVRNSKKKYINFFELDYEEFRGATPIIKASWYNIQYVEIVKINSSYSSEDQLRIKFNELRDNIISDIIDNKNMIITKSAYAIFLPKAQTPSTKVKVSGTEAAYLYKCMKKINSKSEFDSEYTSKFIS